VTEHKLGLLRLDSDRFWQSRPPAEFDQFCTEQADWLDNFVLFMALLAEHQGKLWSHWERAIARREPAALKPDE
jgi:4-alpha-glucanotransferase